MNIVTANTQPLRLQGPYVINGTGSVEIFHEGKWGSICDDGWDMRDARVACRQLGYPDATRALIGIDVGHHTEVDYIWSEVACTGEERNISECSRVVSEYHYCDLGHQAGVQCSSKGSVNKVLSGQRGQQSICHLCLDRRINYHARLVIYHLTIMP